MRSAKHHTLAAHTTAGDEASVTVTRSSSYPTKTPRLSRRLALSMVAILVLAACTPKDLIVDPAVKSKAGMAVIYMGLTGTRRVDEMLGGTTATWVQVDPTTRRFVEDPPVGYNVNSGVCASQYRRRVVCTESGKSYLPIAVPPGTYYLMSLTAAGRNQLSSTKITSFLSTKGLGSGDRFPPKLLARVPKVTVKAGEIVFIGNFRFDTRRFPVAILSYDSDMTILREVLAKQPEILKKVVYRNPLPSSTR